MIPRPAYTRSRDFFRFLQALIALFSCQKETAKNAEFHSLNAQFSRHFSQHRVRKTNFFHIFARIVSKTSFSAINWWVAVRTRGERFLWDNFQINMQKTLRIASNLDVKNNCEMREINVQKTVRNAVNLCAKNSQPLLEIDLSQTFEKNGN